MQYLKKNVNCFYFRHNSILNKENRTKISILPKTIDNINMYFIGVVRALYNEVGWEITSYNGPVLENADILKNIAFIVGKPKKLSKQNDRIMQKINAEKISRVGKHWGRD